MDEVEKSFTHQQCFPSENLLKKPRSWSMGLFGSPNDEAEDDRTTKIRRMEETFEALGKGDQEKSAQIRRLEEQLAESVKIITKLQTGRSVANGDEGQTSILKFLKNKKELAESPIDTTYEVTQEMATKWYSWMGINKTYEKGTLTFDEVLKATGEVAHKDGMDLHLQGNDEWQDS